MKKNIKVKNAGFTLIELLVVMGIMATLVIVVVPQYVSYNQSQGLQNAAASMQATLRTAQNNATSGVKGSGCSPANSAAKWLVEFKSLFSYNISSICSSDITPTPSPVSAGDIALPQGVQISKITFITGNSPCEIIGDEISGLNFFPAVSFDNISGNVAFDAGSSGCVASVTTTDMVITLQSNSNLAGVKIDKGGAISVEAD